MPAITIHNAYLILRDIQNGEPWERLKELDDRTAYLQEGYQFADAYAAGNWDGRVHLLRHSKKENCWKIPTGMLSVVQSMFPTATYTDLRRTPDAKRLKTEWIFPHEMIEYQKEAVEAVMAQIRNGVAPRGLLVLPIRAGKTLVAARIFHETGLKTMFVVPSDLLLRQTKNAFREYLSAPGDWIGTIGAGEFDPQWFTVATIQTLIQDPDSATRLMGEYDLVILDEAHHAGKAEIWRRPILDCDAWGKIGLTATYFDNPNVPSESAAIWVRAALGPILKKVSIRQVIDAGRLIPPDIFIYPMRMYNAPQRGHYASIYEKFIVKNEERNQTIAELARDAVGHGKRVLIDTGRLDQMHALHDLLIAEGIKVQRLHGKTSGMIREHVLAGFKTGAIQVVVGTILGEGVDIPELECVINAEGGKSKTQVMQRLRNLTMHESKASAIVIDFYDIGQKHLENHSASRLAEYDKTDGFQVHRVEQLHRPASIPWDKVSVR